MANSFGEKIRILRKEKKLTLDQLAEMTSSSKSYIWELENKNPPRPSVDKISKIAEVLGVTLDYLMDEKNSQTRENAEDQVFYRKYQNMDEDTKTKIRQMLDVIKGN